MGVSSLSESGCRRARAFALEYLSGYEVANVSGWIGDDSIRQLYLGSGAGEAQVGKDIVFTAKVSLERLRTRCS